MKIYAAQKMNKLSIRIIMILFCIWNDRKQKWIFIHLDKHLVFLVKIDLKQ